MKGNGVLIVLALVAVAAMGGGKGKKRADAVQRTPTPGSKARRDRALGNLKSAGTNVYKTKRDGFVQSYGGLSDEEMAELKASGLLDATDVNLLYASAAEKGAAELTKLFG